MRMTFSACWRPRLSDNPALSEVPPRERASRAGLEIGLEVRGSSRIRELDRDDDPPGAPRGAVGGEAGVVRRKARLEVRGDAGVVTARISFAPENVHALARGRHTADAKQTSSHIPSLEDVEGLPGMRGRAPADPAIPEAQQGGNTFSLCLPPAKPAEALVECRVRLRGGAASADSLHEIESEGW